MLQSPIALFITGFLIGLCLLILIVKLVENKFSPSIYEILVLILLFSIAFGIHGLLHFCDEISNSRLFKTFIG
jgi:hypothetical protein